MVMSNKLVLVVSGVLCTGLLASAVAQTQIIPVAITVEVLKAAKEKDKHPTTPPAAAPGSEDRLVEITVKNPSNQALSNLDIKCWLLVRDVKSRDITIGDADSNTITIPPRSQVVMTSSVAKCDFTPRALGAGKPVPAKGNKFYGYGVQVLEWGKIAAQSYDPPDVKTEIDAAAKKDK